MSTVIVIFESTRAAIEAERACLASGIKCQAIPLPRDISAGCGIALEVNPDDFVKAETVFRGIGISYTMKRRQQ
jgi:hypothetical protein